MSKRHEDCEQCDERYHDADIQRNLKEDRFGRVLCIGCLGGRFSAAPTLAQQRDALRVALDVTSRETAIARRERDEARAERDALRAKLARLQG